MSYAQLVDVNEKDASNIDMVLLKKATVSGVIEVPEMQCFRRKDSM